MIDKSRIQHRTSNKIHLVAKLYSPSTNWPLLNSNLLQLAKKYSLKHDLLLERLRKIKEEYKFKPIVIDPITRKKRLTYRGVGLTAESDSKNPVYEASTYFDADGQFVSSAKGGKFPEAVTASSETEIVPNEVAPDLTAGIFSMFRLPVNKIRIMELAPGGVVAPHFDHPYYEEIRLHAVLESNENVFWEVDGQTFQIPADGRIYWFDTGKIHSVYNLGKTSRSVLSIHLNTKDFFNSNPRLASSSALIENWLASEQL